MGAIAAPILGTSWFLWNRDQQASQLEVQTTQANAAFTSLIGQPPAQRLARLEALARSGNRLDRSRARYLLADHWIKQKQGAKALSHLVGLETTYSLLAPEILHKQAQAYQLVGQPQQAQSRWRLLLAQYPKSPAAAEALYGLGQEDPRSWDQAIAQFPAHPRTVAIAQERLRDHPNSVPLRLLLVRHGLYLPNITAIADRLVEESGEQLTPEDWQAVAFAYWETLNYGKAAAAYAKAPPTALNAYRTGRGFQLDQQRQKALTAYQRLVNQFPRTKEAAQGWLKMAELTEQPDQAIRFLERAVQLSQQLDLPHRAGEALLAKADLLAANRQAAQPVRQQLLSSYSQTEAAATLRWRLAEERAAAGDWRPAQAWSWQIIQENPDSELAPQAAFWAGKWAEKAGRQAEAEAAFQTVLSRYPESYYAWRVASRSGWDVGSFDQVRSLDPTIQALPQRLELPAGSKALQELYRLGLDREAWTRWQWEFQNRVQPTPEEQLTDGLLRVGVGNYLDGLFMVSHLSDRAQEEPKTAKLYRTWEQQPGYWQALYPLPYLPAIEALARQRSLNPLLVMALIRQESRFEEDIRSVVGATGLMQVMPETAAWIAPQMGLQDYRLEKPLDNLNLGTWYLDYTHRAYGNNSMLAIASYNAGPGNVAEWVEQFGLSDPDAFVEAIPFPETKGYVKAVFANYWNYLRLYNPQVSQRLDQKL